MQNKICDLRLYNISCMNIYELLKYKPLIIDRLHKNKNLSLKDRLN